MPHGARLAMVFEYAEQGDMHRYLEAQRATGKYLSERQALSLFRQVAAGTYHLHANGDDAQAPPSPPAPPTSYPPPRPTPALALASTCNPTVTLALTGALTGTVARTPALAHALIPALTPAPALAPDRPPPPIAHP